MELRCPMFFAERNVEASGAMPDLEFAFIYRLRVRGPMPSTKGSPRGESVCWEMSEATLEGPRIKAHTTLPGLDWFAPGPDGFGRPHVRLQFVTDDDAVILLHYTGLVQMNEAFAQAAAAGVATHFGDHYMRMSMTFDTGSPQYEWLNQNLFVAEGRLAGKEQLEYRVYRVT
jgi:hypothetical protein